MRARRIGAVLVASAAAAWGAAACFSEHVSSPRTTIDVAAVCAAQTPPAGIVVIRNFAFSPATITVQSGATVTWVNCETNGTSHTSTSDDNVWRSSLIAPRTTFEHTFDAVGSYGYHCEPHPFMTGTVVVQ
jgi:plastocyanin